MEGQNNTSTFFDLLVNETLSFTENVVSLDEFRFKDFEKLLKENFYNFREIDDVPDLSVYRMEFEADKVIDFPKEWSVFQSFDSCDLSFYIKVSSTANYDGLFDIFSFLKKYEDYFLVQHEGKIYFVMSNEMDSLLGIFEKFEIGDFNNLNLRKVA